MGGLSVDLCVDRKKRVREDEGRENTGVDDDNEGDDTKDMNTDQVGEENDELQDVSQRLNDEIRSKYVKGKKLGEGTYAIVYLGYERDGETEVKRETRTKDPFAWLTTSATAHVNGKATDGMSNKGSEVQRKVAIKKIKINAEFQDGLSFDAIREIKCLQELTGHAHIIELLDVYTSRQQTLHLVLEYLPLGDLETAIRDTHGIQYGLADIKSWMAMLCGAVVFCHSRFILHRDIKPNNLLISSTGAIKLADFGLARSFADPFSVMTHNVITRWYRPPELFLKARYYSGSVDVWSVGTVFAELVLRTPFLPGNTDINQIELITRAIGIPTEPIWPGVSSLDGYEAYMAIARSVVFTGSGSTAQSLSPTQPVSHSVASPVLTIPANNSVVSNNGTTQIMQTGTGNVNQTSSIHQSKSTVNITSNVQCNANNTKFMASQQTSAAVITTNTTGVSGDVENVTGQSTTGAAMVGGGSSAGANANTGVATTGSSSEAVSYGSAGQVQTQAQTPKKPAMNVPVSHPASSMLTPLFTTLGPRGTDLLLSMLHLNPRQRITSERILSHDWWRTNPLATPVHMLPRRKEAETLRPESPG